MPLVFVFGTCAGAGYTWSSPSCGRSRGGVPPPGPVRIATIGWCASVWRSGWRGPEANISQLSNNRRPASLPTGFNVFPSFLLRNASRDGRVLNILSVAQELALVYPKNTQHPPIATDRHFSLGHHPSTKEAALRATVLDHRTGVITLERSLRL